MVDMSWHRMHTHFHRYSAETIYTQFDLWLDFCIAYDASTVCKVAKPVKVRQYSLAYWLFHSFSPNLKDINLWQLVNFLDMDMTMYTNDLCYCFSLFCGAFYVLFQFIRRSPRTQSIIVMVVYPMVLGAVLQASTIPSRYVTAVVKMLQLHVVGSKKERQQS